MSNADDPPHQRGRSGSGRNRVRRLARWTLIALGTLLAAVIVAVGLVAVIGIDLDASRFRGPIAQVLSERLGRTVRLEGPLELGLSLSPRVRMGGIVIANDEGFGGAEFVRLGEAELALDLRPLLSDRLHVRALRAQDVTVRLAQSADGRVNWTFPARTRVPAETSSVPAADPHLPVLDIDRVSLARVQVEYAHARQAGRRFVLQRLDGTARAGEPLRLVLEGSVEERFPYRLELDGDALARLLEGAEPWNFELGLSFLGTVLNARGALEPGSGDWGARVLFGLGTENLEQVEQLLGTRLPPLGAAALSGMLVWSPGRLALGELRGTAGQTSLVGDLVFEFAREGVKGGAAVADPSADGSPPVRTNRPRISGTLALPTLDLRPFLLDDPQAAAKPPKSLADTYRELERVELSLRGLDAFEADVHLAVERWLSLPGDVRGASLHWRLADGQLDAPVRATIAGVAVEGGIQADGRAATPRVRLQFGARETALGGLAELLLGARGVAGKVGRIELALAAEGEQVSALARNLDVRLALERGALTYGNLEGGRPVDLQLDRFNLDARPGQRIQAKARGKLVGQAFNATLSGGTIEALVRDGRLPIALEAGGAGVRARVDGAVAVTERGTGAELAFDVQAARARDVAEWLGVSSRARLPVSLKGRARLSAGERSVRELVVRFGRSVLTGEVSLATAGRRPIVRARLVSERLDASELQDVLPEAERRPERPVIDIPILPAGIDLTDTDVEVRIARVDGLRLEVTDLAFDGLIRNGEMLPSVFGAKVAGMPLAGALALDLRGTEPTAQLWLAGDGIDVGRLLERLDVVRNVGATAGVFRLHAVARASEAGEVLRRSSLAVQIEAGTLSLRDPNTRAELPIRVERAELRADAGEPARATIRGAVDATPVTIELEGAPLRELAAPGDRVPFSIVAQAAESTLRLAGSVALPISARELELSLSWQGAKANRLDPLVRAALPPWGPFTVVGNFRLSKAGYQVQHLAVAVGESVLTGSGSLDTTAGTPRMDITLAADRIQLDDFPIEGWSLVADRNGAPGRPPAPDDKPTAIGAVRTQAQQAGARAETLLSPQVLRRQNARVRVQVKEVRSGRDVLGSGHLNASIEAGRAHIGPVVVNIPGGSATLGLEYEPRERDVDIAARMRVERFDYGVLARRLRADTDLRGTFSLDLALNGRAPHLVDVLASGNGRIDFTVWPERMHAGVFDLWAVNLLVALVPAVDQSLASRVNCAIGRFDVRDGKLVAERLLLDTSRMRVAGAGGADFASQQLGLRFEPRPKEPQFFSLATPVEVGGTFDAYEIELRAADVVQTAGRLLGSIIVVPLQSLFGEHLPKDGHDVCRHERRDAP